MIESVVNCMIQLSKGSLIDILKDLMRTLYPSPLEYIAVVNDFTHVLNDNKEYREEMLSSGLIDFWLEMASRQADNDGTHSSEERTVAIAFLSDLWILFTEKLYQREDLASQILKVLKRASRDRYRPLRVTALAQMFRLLEIFSKTKNTYAPSIYKALAMALVENHGDVITREFIMQSFEQIFETQQTIPVGFVVDPLVNQLQLAEGVSYFYNSVDFQFFVTIAKHPKLHAAQALPLIDILAKIYLNDQAYAQACSRPLMMLVSRFINDRGVHDFLIKFLTVSLSMLLALEKGKISKKIKMPTTMNMNNKTKDSKQSKEEKEVNRTLKKTFIIEAARKIQKLRNATINNELKNLALSTNKRNVELHGHDNTGCLVLLKFYGDPKAMVDKFMQEEEEREKKEAEEEEEKNKNQQLEITADVDPGNASAIEGGDYKGTMDVVPYGDSHRGSAYGNRASSGSRGALVPYMKKKPKGKIGRKAQLEIERLQKDRKERSEYEKLRDKQLKMKDKKSKQKLAEELEKRKIEHGVNSLQNKKKGEKKLIFDEGEVDKFKEKETKSGLPEIELFDFEEEEQRDVDAIKIFMKKYSKLWRFYFNKYANMCYSGKHIRNFDMLNEKLNTINVAELTKLLKEHDFDKRYLTKEELAAIIRLVNFKKINKSDLTALTYAGFLEWVIQASIYMFTKPPEDKSHFPPVECLHAFVRKLEKAQKDKGASTILFEDPDITSIGDTTLLKALNKKIKEDPNYPLPEDYKKVKEKEFVYTYKLPNYIPIDDSKRVCMEILDDIIFEKFEVHILEPLVDFKEVLKVKPVIRKQYDNQGDGRSTPRYLQSLDKRQKPKELAEIPKKKAQADHPKPEVKLGETVALEAAKFPREQRNDIKEVAQCLELLLRAVERGQNKLPDKKSFGPSGITNPALEEHKKKEEDAKKLEKEREHKRKLRDKQIKNKLKKQEEEKKKRLEETKEERKQAREAKKKKEKELKEKRDKEREQRMKEIEEKKEKQREELEKIMKEEEEKEKQRKESSKNKDFYKEQAKKIKKAGKEMLEKRESIKKGKQNPLPPKPSKRPTEKKANKKSK